MITLTHVLCPVDFSDASRGSLQHAHAVAKHFSARLTLLTVDDPLLAEVAAHSGPALAGETERDLRRFGLESIRRPSASSFRVVVGKPAPEILRFARDEKVDLIVMSSEGRSGARKVFFGSTTERVLRETTIPVFLPPAARGASDTIAGTARWVHRIVAPVDLGTGSAHQVDVAGAIAAMLSVPLLLIHVLEPAFVPFDERMTMVSIDRVRRQRAEEQLMALTASLPQKLHAEALVLNGDPSSSISHAVERSQANLIVMGLHSEGVLGPRMGSTTYRILCLTHAGVLVLPFKPRH